MSRAAVARAERQPALVLLNLHQLEAVLGECAPAAGGRAASPDLRRACRKVGRAVKRRRKAVERASRR